MAEPPASKIDTTIRQVVKNIYDEGNLEELTVKRVRTAAEKQLGLPERWFRDHEEWKDKSAELIKRVALSYDEGTLSQPVESQQKPEEVTSPPKTKKNKRPSEPTKISEPRKRVKKSETPNTPPTKKRAANSKSTAVENEAASPKVTKKEPAKPKQPKKTKKVIDSDDSDGQSEGNVETSPPVAKTEHAPSPDAVAENGHSEERSKDDLEERLQGASIVEQSESELSSLIDEEPTKRKKKSKEPPAKKTKGKTSKAKEVDPKEDEIKKLKDWLKKCGINKRWLELDKMDSQKERISYLKQQLANAGMDGRYSLAKAKEIRERRELEEELEEAQKFEQAWGTKMDRSRPKSAAEVMADMGVDLDNDDSEE